jgi:hypothetical protein
VPVGANGGVQQLFFVVEFAVSNERLGPLRGREGQGLSGFLFFFSSSDF